MLGSSSDQISERVRALLMLGDPPAEARLDMEAARLGVTSADLQSILAGRVGLDSVRALEAIVRQFGVDPSWLITGVYDAATHHEALDNGSTSGLRSLLERTLRSTDTDPRPLLP